MKTLTLTLLIIFAAGGALADIPHTMGYQGVLVDNMGAAVPDGDYTITFRLYHSDSGGSAFWSETLLVPVSGGRFDVILGKTTVLDPGFGAPYWLSLEIAPDPEMTDRIELTAVPYALNIKDEVVTQNKIAPNTVVRSINGLKDDVVVKAGANINVSTSGDTITVSGSGGGGLALPFVGSASTILNTSAFAVTQDGHGHAALFETTDPQAAGHSLLVRGIGSVPPARIEFNDPGGTGVHALEVVTQKQNTRSARFEGGRGITVEHDTNSQIGIELHNTDPGGSSQERISFHNEDGGVAFLTAIDDDFITLITRNSLLMANNRPSARLTFQANGNLGMTLQSDGALELGYFAQNNLGFDGELRLMRADLNGEPVMSAYNNSHGAALEMKDELGNKIFEAKPDTDGEGCFLDVYNEPNTIAFRVDGNYLGSGDPRVFVFGQSPTFFLADQPGDGSVALSNDAISAPEILDEPGAASATGITTVTLTGGIETVLSRTITAPTAGYVLVIATSQVTVNHVSGSNSLCNVGVSDEANAFPSNQDVALFFNTQVPTGQYVIPATVHGLFSVSAGANTFYFHAQENGGNSSLLDSQLTTIFIPTAYGTISPTASTGPLLTDAQSPERGGLTRGEIADEQARSVADNQGRIDAELAAMRDRIAALERELAQERETAVDGSTRPRDVLVWGVGRTADALFK